MAALDVPPRVAIEVGHAQSSTTMEVYTHVAPELAREATDRAADAIWGEGWQIWLGTIRASATPRGWRPQ